MFLFDREVKTYTIKAPNGLEVIFDSKTNLIMPNGKYPNEKYPDLVKAPEIKARMILDAIEKSEGNIQDAIKDGFDSENKSVDMKSKRNKNCEECENIISKLATKYQLLDNNIANTNKLLTVIGSVISILIAGFGIALTIFIFSVNSQYGAINDSVNSKFDSIDTKIEAINQRLDYQEKLNSFQIQRDVVKEFKLQK